MTDDELKVPGRDFAFKLITYFHRYRTYEIYEACGPNGR